jgi:hypothetical protein
MKIAIGIAFHNRINKLERLLKSINNRNNVYIFILCDNEIDYDNVTHLIKNCPATILLNKEAQYVVKKWNWFYRNTINLDYIGFLNLVDDVELKEDTIEQAINYFLTNYPDTDGIIGFNQECPNHPEYTFQPTGQTLIGSKFLKRYKEVDYQVCCPAYQQWYQDNETFQYAVKLGKFKFCKKATLLHYHPAFIKEEMDNTHFLIRIKILNEDRKIYMDRQSEGLIWGDSWKLI